MAKFSDILSFYMLASNKNRSIYGFILQQLKVLPGGKNIPTMAVGVRDRRLCLYINEDWVEAQPALAVMDTLEHEAVHIIANHIPRWLELFDENMLRILNLKDLANIAADLAANSFLMGANSRINEENGWLIPGKTQFPEHKTEWSMEEHLAYLLETLPRQNAVCLRQGCTHHPWKDAEEVVPHDAITEISEHVKIVAAQAKEKYEKTFGTLPSNVATLINALLAPPKIDWREVMKNLAQGSLLTSKQRSLKRPYRRHIGLHALGWYPGRAADLTHNIVMCIDTSGSMGEDVLSQAIGILEDMKRLQPELIVTVIEADADVSRIYSIDEYSGVQWSVTGRGGTCFDPAIEAARGYNPDIVFYYTDGYGPAPSERVTCPMVWLICPGGTVPCPKWGHVLSME